MLPKELWNIILLQSRIIDLLPLQLVCKTFNEIICSKFFRDFYTDKNMSDQELINYFKDNSLSHEYLRNHKIAKIGSIIILELIFAKGPYFDDAPEFYTINYEELGPKFIENYKIWPLKVINYREVPRYGFAGSYDSCYSDFDWTVKCLYSNDDPFIFRFGDGHLCVEFGGITVMDSSKIEI